MKFLIVATIFALCVQYAYSQCSQARSYPSNKQCDTTWGSNVFGADTTICKAGCLVCSMASGLAGAGKKIGTTTPNCANLNTWLKSNGGYSGNLFVWASVNKLGVTFESKYTSIQTIKDAICANKIVILNVRSGGHWVLAKGYTVSGTTTTFTVMDPGYTQTTYLASEVSQAGVYKVL